MEIINQYNSPKHITTMELTWELQSRHEDDKVWVLVAKNTRACHGHSYTVRIWYQSSLELAILENLYRKMLSFLNWRKINQFCNNCWWELNQNSSPKWELLVCYLFIRPKILFHRTDRLVYMWRDAPDCKNTSYLPI